MVRSSFAIPTIGWFGRRNVGDEAFRDVHQQLLPDIPLSWLQHGQSPNYLPNIPLRDDLCIVSAGDIISPFYFDEIPRAARIIIYGAGIAWDEEINLLEKHRHRLLGIWVRNEQDVTKLNTRGLLARSTPDIVFNLSPSDKTVFVEGQRKRLIVIMSDSQRADALRANDYKRFTAIQNFYTELAVAIDYYAEWYDVTFIPFSFDVNDFDLAAIFDLVPRLSKRGTINVIDKELTPKLASEAIASANLVLTMKFHGVVYALLNDVPFVAISDARKVQLICEENGFTSQYLSVAGFSADALKSRVSIAESDSFGLLMKKTVHSMVNKCVSEAKRFRETLLKAI